MTAGREVAYVTYLGGAKCGYRIFRAYAGPSLKDGSKLTVRLAWGGEVSADVERIVVAIWRTEHARRVLSYRADRLRRMLAREVRA
jgi:hypothetical protein